MTCKDCIHYDVCMVLDETCESDINVLKCEEFIPARFVDIVSSEIAKNLIKIHPNKPEVGKWILIDGVIETFYKCSLCGFKHQMQQTQYCPNCGSLMKPDMDFGSILEKIWGDEI